MKSKRMAIRTGLLLTLGGGMLFSNGCMNLLTSIQICGVVVPVTVCTPEDQLLLTFQFQEVPNYTVDPTCTIPTACDNGGAVGDYPFDGTDPEQPDVPAGGSVGGGVGGGGAGGGGGGGGAGGGGGGGGVGAGT